MRVKAILKWFKSELERNFKAEKSSLIQLESDVLGDNGDYLIFESEQIAVDLWYWNTGIINMGGVDKVADEMLMNFSFVPDDYHTKEYPKESEEIFGQKINELLSLLHNKNPNIKSHLPNNV